MNKKEGGRHQVLFGLIECEMIEYISGGGCYLDRAFGAGFIGRDYDGHNILTLNTGNSKTLHHGHKIFLKTLYFRQKS